MHCFVWVFCITLLSSLSAHLSVFWSSLVNRSFNKGFGLFVFLTLSNTLGENSGHSHWVVKIISSILTQICRLTPWEHVETPPYSNPHTYVYTQEQQGWGMLTLIGMHRQFLHSLCLLREDEATGLQNCQRAAGLCWVTSSERVTGLLSSNSNSGHVDGTGSHCLLGNDPTRETAENARVLSTPTLRRRGP